MQEVLEKSLIPNNHSLYRVQFFMNISLSHLLPQKTTLAGIIVACSFLFLLASPVHAVSSATTQMQLIQTLMEMIVTLKAQLEALQAQESDDAYAGNTPYSCVELSQSLWFGTTDATTNGQVGKLQKFLQNTGDFTYGEITGRYGPATVSAVQKWQKRNGIISYGTPDTTGYGTVGEATIKAMRKGCVSDTGPMLDGEIIKEIGSIDENGIKFQLSIDVTAINDDIYILADNLGKFYQVYRDGILISKENLNISENDASNAEKVFDSNQVGFYSINEGETRSFKLTVHLTPGVSGAYQLRSPGVDFRTTPDGMTKAIGHTSGYVTKSVFWNGSANETIQASIKNITNSENPTISGTAAGTKIVGFAISNGDKVYGSGNVAVVNGKWSHKVKKDLEDGEYEVVVYINNVEYERKSFSIGATIDESGDSPSVDFEVYPSIITAGDEYTVSLSTSGIQSCNVRSVINGVANSWSVVPLNFKESQDVSADDIQESTLVTYTLRCFTNDGVYVEENRKLTIEPQSSSKPTMTLTASPTSGTLNSNRVLWVDVDVTGYTPLGTEIIDYGDGTQSALGYTASTNGRHDYHTPGTYTIRLMNENNVIATTQVMVRESVETPPYSNRMSCSNPPKTGLANGVVACYGLWDFGDSFGNDQSMCPNEDENGYDGSAQTGCVLETRACTSGYAKAVSAINTYAPWHSNGSGAALATKSDVSRIASYLNVAESLITKEIIRIWEYECYAPVSTRDLPHTSPLVGSVSTKAVACTTLPVNMHRGAESGIVRDLQNFLIGKGILLSEATGFYGDQTIEAVKAYQGMVGLKQTGMVYEFTRNAIQKETCTP